MSKSELSDLENLLNGIKTINDEYRPHRFKKEFNLFQIIRKGHEEVPLHSRFIYELLDPNGSHDMGSRFLDLFIDRVNKLHDSFDFIKSNAKVHYENQNIDLLIQNHSQAIIIENKIYAQDQPNQIYRYCDIVFNRGIKDIYIIYLTLDGKSPSQQSLSCPDVKDNYNCDPKTISNIINDRLFNCSYHTHIKDWLRTCNKCTHNNPTVHNCIMQYIKLIENLTQSKEVEERMKLVEHLGNRDLMEQAYYLVDNWNNVKQHIEKNFWSELQHSLPKSLIDDDNVSICNYTVENIVKSAHSARRGDQYDLELDLYLTDAHKIVFTVERGVDGMAYGLRINPTLATKPSRITKPAELISHLKKIAPMFIMGEEQSDWLQWKYVEPSINFVSFDDPITLSLANPAKRKEIIEALCKQMSQYIQEVMSFK
jgi:hypothetical protein